MEILLVLILLVLLLMFRPIRILVGGAIVVLAVAYLNHTHGGDSNTLLYAGLAVGGVLLLNHLFRRGRPNT